MLILLVDDDVDDFEIFSDAVKIVNPEIKCLHAPDGQQAFELLKRGRGALPDYIFLDINMPVMNGRECLSLIKQEEDLKRIPVIIYSTSSDRAEMETCKFLGAREFIVKPGSFEKLVTLIGQTIRKG